MRGEGRLLRAAEYLVRHACQRLPDEIREDRCREWAAELPAILHDPSVRPAARRAGRMLAYAAGTQWAAAKGSGRAWHLPTARTVRIGFLIFAQPLVLLNLVQAPRDWVSYVYMAPLAFLIAMFIIRRRVMMNAASYIMLAAVQISVISQLVQAPRDWVSYLPLWPLAPVALLIPVLILLSPMMLVALTRKPRGRHSRSAPSVK